jgi:hypothetical protein
MKESFFTQLGYENQCEVIELLVDHQVVACWGDLCERYRHPQSH